MVNFRFIANIPAYSKIYNKSMVVRGGKNVCIYRVCAAERIL